MRTAGIEGRRSARELAEAAGFRLEDHQAVTADGFVLILHRLVDPDRVVSGCVRACRHMPRRLLSVEADAVLLSPSVWDLSSAIHGYFSLAACILWTKFVSRTVPFSGRQ